MCFKIFILCCWPSRVCFLSEAFWNGLLLIIHPNQGRMTDKVHQFVHWGDATDSHVNGTKNEGNCIVRTSLGRVKRCSPPPPVTKKSGLCQFFWLCRRTNGPPVPFAIVTTFLCHLFALHCQSRRFHIFSSNFILWLFQNCFEAPLTFLLSCCAF